MRLRLTEGPRGGGAERASDLFLAPPAPALWDRLKMLRDEGLFDEVGVRHASDDPVGVARRFKPDLLQAPASLLDQRLLLDGSLMAVRDMGIEVHLRSIFLNGLLFLPPIGGAGAVEGRGGRRAVARPPHDRRRRSDPAAGGARFLSRPRLTR